MSSRRSQRGMVLLVVLWAIALCSALVMATSTTFRSLAGIVRIDRDRVQGGALLTAGLEGAAGIVAALRGGLLTERSVTLAFPTGSVRVTVADEGGRIDIGRAPVELLASLLRSVGAEDDDAGILAHTRVVARPLHSERATRSIALIWRRASPRERDFRLLAGVLAALR